MIALSTLIQRQSKVVILLFSQKRNFEYRIHAYCHSKLPLCPSYVRSHIRGCSNVWNATCQSAMSYSCIFDVVSTPAVFSVWKSLQVLKKLASRSRPVLFTLTDFFFSYILLVCCKQKRPLFNYVYYETILVWGLVSVWISTPHIV